MINLPYAVRRDIFSAVVAGIDGNMYYNRQDEYHRLLEQNYCTAAAVWAKLERAAYDEEDAKVKGASG